MEAKARASTLGMTGSLFGGVNKQRQRRQKGAGLKTAHSGTTNGNSKTATAKHLPVLRPALQTARPDGRTKRQMLTEDCEFIVCGTARRAFGNAGRSGGWRSRGWRRGRRNRGSRFGVLAGGRRGTCLYRLLRSRWRPASTDRSSFSSRRSCDMYLRASS